MYEWFLKNHYKTISPVMTRKHKAIWLHTRYAHAQIFLLTYLYMCDSFLRYDKQMYLDRLSQNRIHVVLKDYYRLSRQEGSEGSGTRDDVLWRHNRISLSMRSKDPTERSTDWQLVLTQGCHGFEIWRLQKIKVILVIGSLKDQSNHRMTLKLVKENWKKLIILKITEQICNP